MFQRFLLSLKNRANLRGGGSGGIGNTNLLVFVYRSCAINVEVKNMVNNSKGGLVDIARHSQLLFYSLPSAVMEANNCKILESTLFTIELWRSFKTSTFFVLENNHCQLSESDHVCRR